MKLMGVLIVILFVFFGFFAVWGACEGAYEMVKAGASTRVELFGNWFLIIFTLLAGLMSFAAAPIIINEL